MRPLPPPHSIETERAVLGAIIMGGKLGAAKDLTPDDFYKQTHRDIFKGCVDLHAEGAPIDLVSVSGRANGSAALVAEIAGEAVTAANLAYHVRGLQALAYKRVVLKKVFSIIEGVADLDPADISARLLEVAKPADFIGLNRREVSLSSEVQKWISLTDGDWNLTELDKALREVIGLTIPYTRNNLHQIVHRLKTDGVIQKVGNKNGVYRRVDDAAEEIEWWGADTEALPVQYPLGIEQFVLTYPRNIVVVAGESNSGKTAFLLNLALACSRKFRPTYLSSEMGAIELRNRLSKFEGPLDQWRKVAFKERSGNFADVLDPDGVTIIDFLEITDDFYRIAAFIKEFHDRLNKGICVVAIQKNRGTDFGRGGQLGLEKPRLYLAMEPGKIKIVKAKAWAKEGVNPVGLQQEFKLVQGAKFISASPWHREGEKW